VTVGAWGPGPARPGAAKLALKPDTLAAAAAGGRPFSGYQVISTSKGRISEAFSLLFSSFFFLFFFGGEVWVGLSLFWLFCYFAVLVRGRARETDLPD